MASTIPPILVQLQADVTQLKAGLAQAESAIKGVDNQVKKAGAGMGQFSGQLKKLAVGIGAAFSAAAVMNFAKQSVMASSNMEESLSKVAVVFGQGSAEVEEFGRNAAVNLGISNQAALEAAGTYGNLFQAFGLGQGESQKMSTSLVQLASDMASFNNTSVDDAILALRSGLSGETEPLKRFGVALSEVRLKEEAMRMGLIKTMSGTLPVAAKSQAAYALIMRDTALAQGDYARTAEGTANTMKTLQARFEDAKVAIGDALMPAFRGLLEILNLLIPVLTATGKFLKQNTDAIKAFAGVVVVAYAGMKLYRGILILTAIAKNTYQVATVLMRRGQLATIASTNTLAASMLRLKAIMRANVIGIVITAVALLAAGIVTLWKRSETFRNVVINVAKVALNAFASIIPMVGKVYEVIMKVVTGPLRALLTVLSKLPGVGKFAKAGLEIMNKGLDGISGFAQGAANKAKILAANLDNVGNAATKATDKVNKATKGGTGGATGTTTGGAVDQKALDKIKKYKKDVQDIYKDMREVAAEANEKMLEAAADRDEKIADANERYLERVADANKAYAEAEADAKTDNAKRLIDITKDYNKKTAELAKDLAEKVADINARAADKSADLRVKALEKEASIVKQSVDRLRSAFASKTGFNLAESFAAGPSADKLLTDLKVKLQAAKDLQANAAALAGMGYSQTFIEEVVKNGPEAGNKIAAALKDASPEATKQLQALYGQVENISDNGLNELAKSMNAGGKLATDELREAYSQVAVDLKNSLAEVDSELKTSLAEANKVYSEAMTKAQIDRDERSAESVARMNEQIADAKKRLGEALADAQKDLNKALLEAQIAYQKAIDKIQKDTEKKLADLKAKLAEVAKAMAALGAQQAAMAAMAKAPTYTFSGSTGGGSTGTTTGGGTTVNNNTTVNAFTNANPNAIATAVTNAAKFSAPITTNTTTLAGIMAASGVKTPALSSAQIVANRRRSLGYL
jgi:hypothetical protein